jgi:dipeptidyl aminopeptidase/acylaminoacyl peptidase
VPEKSTEQYEEADVDALSIYLETEIKSLVREADGTLAGVDAVVAKFTIADMPVELITNKIGIDQNDRHFATISTKQFGTIRLTLSQFGGGTVWLTSSQKRTVLSLRAAQALGAAKATTEGYSQRWVAETKARRLVAYLTKRASGFDLNIVGLDGSNQKRVTDGVQDARDPRWSPDGRYLAFAVYERSGKRALWRVNADGSGMLRLIECASGGVFPVWAPDGLRIAYEQKNGEMHVIDSDGKNDRRLTESADHFARAWSPDGSLIAFDKFQGGTFRVGYIMTNGTEERVLPEGAHPYAGEDSNPSFSNDGKHILFQSDRDGATAIFVFDTESSTLRRLTSPTHRSFAPTFVPIGGRVVVSVKW